MFLPQTVEDLLLEFGLTHRCPNDLKASRAFNVVELKCSCHAVVTLHPHAISLFATDLLSPVTQSQSPNQLRKNVYVPILHQPAVASLLITVIVSTMAASYLAMTWFECLLICLSWIGIIMSHDGTCHIGTHPTFLENTREADIPRPIFDCRMSQWFFNSRALFIHSY